jgi:hypothetical protein
MCAQRIKESSNIVRANSPVQPFSWRRWLHTDPVAIQVRRKLQLLSGFAHHEWIAVV